MPALQRLHFSTVIHAPVETVWRLMLGATTYRQWTAAFCEGSDFEGSWQAGETIKFIGPTGDGMFAQIVENRRHEFVSIKHLGYIHKGVVDTTSDAIRAWAPAYENYTFTPMANSTRLDIDQDMTAEYEQYMKESWPRALTLLKEICEQEADQR